ncbi:MAG: ATP-binding protein [Acidobacteriota bacterium]
MTTTLSVTVNEVSQVGEARRVATALGRRCGLDETTNGRLALVVTEVGTNLVKHAGGGRILVRALRPPADGIEVLAIDTGPGMGSVIACLRDGFSTKGSPGTGLGAVSRVADEFEVYSLPGRGAVLLARVLARGRPAAARTFVEGVAAHAYGHGDVSGDGWAIQPAPDRLRVLVADGLGHGPDAAAAAHAAVSAFESDGSGGPAAAVERLHAALRHTRGAAVAVAEVRPRAGVVAFCGVGNISAALTTEAGMRSLASYNGTAGVEARKIAEFTYPWTEGAVLIVHTDGVSGRWNLEDYPGLATRHPGLIAGVLLRDFGRDSDDATVVAVRPAGPAARGEERR